MAKDPSIEGAYARKKVKEIERRYLLRSFDRSILTGMPYRTIEQAYFGPDIDLRVRITDGLAAEFTSKAGKGEERDEDNQESPLIVARFALEKTPFRFVKHRYTIGRWEVDVFQGVLLGLVLAEFEKRHKREIVVIPDWMANGTFEDVTDTLSNRTLGLLVPLLAMRDPTASVHDYLPRDLPAIVITGAPCSGKTGAIKRLRTVFGGDLQYVDEVATMVSKAVGMSPAIADPVDGTSFQHQVYRIQHGLEQIARTDALRKGRKGLLLDRGMVDNAVYMPGGPDNFTVLKGRAYREEYDRYRSVICLATPPEAIYEANKDNNDARSETYAQAVALGERIRAVWQDHPGFVFVENHANWDEKCAAIETAVRRALDAG